MAPGDVIRLRTFHHFSVFVKLRSLTSANMRAVVFLCLLLEAVSEDSPFNWGGTGSGPVSPECLSASCGCCMIEKQLNRMRKHFDFIAEEMNTYLTKSKTALNHTTARSAFSVSLTNNMSCSVPAAKDEVIVYGNVLLNLGGDYDVQKGVFTAPHTGVYSLTVTIHGSATSGATNVPSCARLQVNGREVVATLSEKHGLDPQDSSSIVAALKLNRGDEVAVFLPQGCVICNKNKVEHFNTFTGVLLYLS